MYDREWCAESARWWLGAATRARLGTPGRDTHAAWAWAMSNVRGYLRRAAAR